LFQCDRPADRSIRRGFRTAEAENGDRTNRGTTVDPTRATHFHTIPPE